MVPCVHCVLAYIWHRAATMIGRSPSKRSAGAASDAPCHCAQDCEDWDAVAAEMGWTLEQCLAHKLAFKKKDDPKVKAEAMAAQMRRLRAAGRHLLSLTRS